MPKIVYPICCGMDVHKSFVVAWIASPNAVGVITYESKRFSTLPVIYEDAENGWWIRVAKMSVWNLQENTGFRSTTF